VVQAGAAELIERLRAADRNMSIGGWLAFNSDDLGIALSLPTWIQPLFPTLPIPALPALPPFPTLFCPLD